MDKGGAYLEGPQHPADVGQVPQQGDGHDVGADDAEGDLLGVVDGQVAAGEDDGRAGGR